MYLLRGARIDNFFMFVIGVGYNAVKVARAGFGRGTMLDPLTGGGIVTLAIDFYSVSLLAHCLS